MDVAFEFVSVWAATFRLARFQSLFLWMLLLNFKILVHYSPLTTVSILVLMDVAFESAIVIIFSSCIMCFNPCSYGCCFWISATTNWTGAEVVGFNPCSYGCCFWIGPLHLKFAGVSKFQSLFLWMLLLNSSLPSLRCLLYLVSILVLMDVAFECLSHGFSKLNYFGFNPCSYGCCFWITNLTESTLPLLCFNPCSYGCCFWILLPPLTAAGF